jgi:hypothetical protein
MRELVGEAAIEFEHEASATRPLLFPFVGPAAGGAQRLRVPTGERAVWSAHVAAIERELREPRDGSNEAVLAHLTLQLVSMSRVSVDLGHDLRLRNEPLLADVFEFIEEHYREDQTVQALPRGHPGSVAPAGPHTDAIVAAGAMTEVMYA